MSDRHAPSADAPNQPVVYFPEATLLVRPLEDTLIDLVGHDPLSPYVEQFWLGILGPSATLLIRRLALALNEHPEGCELDTSDLALELGLGNRGGRHSPLWRAIDRLCRFGIARREGEVLEQRTKLPTLTLRQINKLPPHLKAAHDAWEADALAEHQRAA